MNMNGLCLGLCIYLDLKLAHSDRQVQNQLSHVLQLALQQLNGLSLSLILCVKNRSKFSLKKLIGLATRG